MKNEVIKEIFSTTDSILIIDSTGRIMFYQGFDDEINTFKNEDLTSMTIFELYPFIAPDNFTVMKAIKNNRIIINELQTFIFKGKTKRSVNSAYPLINNGRVVGGLVLSLDLDKATHPTKYNFEDILTENPEFLRRLNALRVFSRTNSSILIYGETGTGKELIAHTIHANSKRQNKPFIIQNCAAIPSNLMESIFFGTARGSFTGAVDKIGLFEAANGGTLFLDEINSLPLDLQGKILRAIENKAITRIGEHKEKNIDVRIIASTNEDLSEKIYAKEFRADLYYRLNVVRFDIPPLRSRPSDVRLYANHYIHYYNSLLDRDISGIDADALEVLTAYSWPGNVREIKNMFESIFNIKRFGYITLKDLPDYILHPTADDIAEPKGMVAYPSTSFFDSQMADLSLGSQLDALEEKIIRETFLSCNYNISKTAQILKVSRQTLYNKLHKYNLL